MVAMNNGQVYTFRRGNAGSIIDLIIASSSMASKIDEWRVLEEITLSNYQYIAVEIEVQKDNLDRNHLPKAKIMNDFGWSRKSKNMYLAVKYTKMKIFAACDASML